MGYTTLYIIGNGFDIHHGINSRYTDYETWLEVNMPEVYGKILENFMHTDSDWWKDFEQNLSTFNVEGYAAERARENYPDLFGDNLAREFDTIVYESKQDAEILLHEILQSFESWIRSLNAPNPTKRISIRRGQSLFINFNYTSTLEEIYGIPKCHICHIHGSVDGSEPFIVGHGRIPPKRNSGEVLIDEDERDYVTDMAEQAVPEAATVLHKDVQGIIEKHWDVWEKLANVERICIYGFSFSEIDMPYLQHILRNVSSDVAFEISYYSDEDYQKILKFMYDNNFKPWQYQLVKLSDLISDSQLSLFDM